MNDQMDEAHRRDSQTERLSRDAVRALNAVLDDDHRLTPRKRAVILHARDLLRERADHIVAVWD